MEYFQDLYKPEQVVEWIKNGKTLLIAGDEQLLKKLPKGNWIGGTIPYFMTSLGGKESAEHLFVSLLPDYFSNPKVNVYDENTIDKIYHQIPRQGVGFIIIPGMTNIHTEFANKVRSFPKFAAQPLIGWVSGFH